MAPIFLDLSLDPRDAPRLRRAPELSSAVVGRAEKLAIIWHDTGDHALAASGCALAEQRRGRTAARAGSWRLERMRPEPDAPWPPGAPPPILAEAATLAAIATELAARGLGGTFLPVAAFDGETRALVAGGATLTVVSGALRAIAGEQPVCRVLLHGEAAQVAALARGLARSQRLALPVDTLAAEAYAVGGARPPPVRPGALELGEHLSVSDAFTRVLGHLTTVILHNASRVLAGETPEPVHQMRVALRRLKSAFALFRRAIACPEYDDARAALRALGDKLGPARDWDVFLAGGAARAQAALPTDHAVARLCRRARRRRDDAYAALRDDLDGPAFRALGVTLALLAATRPWEMQPEAAAPPAPAASDGRAEDSAEKVPPRDWPLSAFAARSLRRRYARLVAPGADIAALPAPDLHAIRLDAKRLRYTAEFFAPLFPGRPTRRFIRRLAALQERLGVLNDGAVAAGLLAEIGQARSYAGGVVLGAIASDSADGREKIERSWNKFRRADRFWR